MDLGLITCPGHRFRRGGQSIPFLPLKKCRQGSLRKGERVVFLLEQRAVSGVAAPSAWGYAYDEQVRVVQHKHTKTLFALKYINKPKCVKMKAVANIVQERRLLEEVSAWKRVHHLLAELALLHRSITHLL